MNPMRYLRPLIENNSHGTDELVDIIMDQYEQIILKGETVLANVVNFINKSTLDYFTDPNATIQPNPFAYQFITPNQDLDNPTEFYSLNENVRSVFETMLIRMFYQYSISGFNQDTEYFFNELVLYTIQHVSVLDRKKPIFRTALTIRCFIKNGTFVLEKSSKIEYIPDSHFLEYKPRIDSFDLFNYVKTFYTEEESRLTVPVVDLNGFYKLYNTDPYYNGFFVSVVELPQTNGSESIKVLVVINNQPALGRTDDNTVVLDIVKDYIDLTAQSELYQQFSDCPALWKRPYNPYSGTITFLNGNNNRTFSYDLKEDKIPILAALLMGQLTRQQPLTWG